MKSLSEMGLSHDGAKAYVQYHVCSCGAALTLAWGGTWDIQDFVVRCARDPEHTTFEKPAQYNPHTDPAVPGWKLSNRRKKALDTKLGPEKAHALMKYQGVAVLSKVELTDIINTMWPGAGKASPSEVKKAILLCAQYGLNPLANHLYLIPFETKDKKTGQVTKVTYATVRGINARRLIARRKHSYSEINGTPRYMTEAEEQRAWKTINEDEVRFIVTLRDTVTGATASGYGRWPKYKMWTSPKNGEVKKYPNEPKGVEKGNSMENMAAIRGERIALDKLYPADMPTSIPFEDELRETMGSSTPKVDAAVDTVTGEIIEGEYVETPFQGEEETGEVSEPEGGAEDLFPRGGEGAETVSSSPQEQTEPKNREVAPGADARDADILMARGAAGKLKWDNSRLLKELKQRTGFANFDQVPADQLHDFASKVVDLSELA